jgi:hypothetical protein
MSRVWAANHPKTYRRPSPLITIVAGRGPAPVVDVTTTPDAEALIL